MANRSARRVPLGVRLPLAAAVVGLCVAGWAAPNDALAVCLPENDPPRSLRQANGSAGGFDVAVARLAAARLQAPLRLVWLPEPRQTDIESTDLDFRPLLRGECDVQLSVPGAAAIANYQPRLELTAPYYGAAYELLPADAALRWNAPFAGTVAVRANTVAHVAVDAAGLRWTMQRSTADILAALASGDATAALIWGPALAAVDDAPSAAFEPPPALRWNLHAATRREHPLRATLDGLFTDAATQQSVLALLAEHGLPPRAPFATAHTPAALRNVARR